MSSWGNIDANTSSPKWATTQVNLRPTQANANALYDNTTANSFAVTLGDGSVRLGNTTVGLFLVDANEETVAKFDGAAPAHSGWVLRTTGQGGRAGRVTQEVLVCLNTAVGDGDSQTYANVVIQLSGPTNATVTHGAANANVATFTVTPTLTGNTSANLTYQWQVNNNTGGTWVNMVNGANNQPSGAIAANVTTATLSVTPWTTSANLYVFRCIVTAADEGVTATSANGLITIF
jgi:hypothetical protein